MQNIDFDAQITDFEDILIYLSNLNVNVKSSEDKQNQFLENIIHDLNQHFKKVTLPQDQLDIISAQWLAIFQNKTSISSVNSSGQNPINSDGHLLQNFTIKFIRKLTESDWPETELQKRIFAGIGFLHANDTDSLSSDVARYRKQMNALKIQHHCIIIIAHMHQLTSEQKNQFVSIIQQQDQAGENQNQNQQNLNKALYLFIENDDIQQAQVTQEIMKMIQEQLLFCIVSSMLSELQSLRNESSSASISTIFFNLKEEKVQDAAKLKKKKTARTMKVTADLSLKVHQHAEAIMQYGNAIEACKSNRDYLWRGLSHEGLACALVQKHKAMHTTSLMELQNETNSTGEQEISKQIKNALRCYLKLKDTTMQFECLFRLLDFHARMTSRCLLADYVRFAFDSFPSLHSLHSQQIVSVYSKVAALFYEVGFFRNCALVLFRLANQLKQLKPNEASQQENILLACANLYDVPNLLHHISCQKYVKPQNQQIMRITWPRVQLIYLNELLSVVNDPCKQQGILVLLLSTFYAELTEPIQRLLFQQLELNSFKSHIIKTIQPVNVFPEVFRVRLINTNSANLFKRNDKYQVKSQEVQVSNANKGLFIFSPWQKATVEAYQLARNEMLVFEISVNNVFNVSITAVISFQTIGVDAIQYPTKVEIPPKAKNFQAFLKMACLSTGILKVTGIRSHIYNLQDLQELDSKGFSKTYISMHGLREIKEADYKMLPELSMQILDEYPQLSIQFRPQDSSLQMNDKTEKNIFNNKQIFLCGQELCISFIFALQSVEHICKIQSLTICIDFKQNIPFVEFDVTSETINEIEKVLNKSGTCNFRLFKPQAQQINSVCFQALPIKLLENKNSMKKIAITCKYLNNDEQQFVKELSQTAQVHYEKGIDIYQINIMDAEEKFILLKQYNNQINSLQIPESKLSEYFWMKAKIINWAQQRCFNLRFHSEIFEEELMNESEFQIEHQIFYEKVFKLRKVKQLPSQQKNILQIDWQCESLKGSSSFSFHKLFDCDIDKIKTCPFRISLLPTRQDQQQSQQHLDNSIIQNGQICIKCNHFYSLEFIFEFDEEFSYNDFKCHLQIRPEIEAAQNLVRINDTHDNAPILDSILLQGQHTFGLRIGQINDRKFIHKVGILSFDPHPENNVVQMKCVYNDTQNQSHQYTFRQKLLILP